MTGRGLLLAVVLGLGLLATRVLAEEAPPPSPDLTHALVPVAQLKIEAITIAKRSPVTERILEPGGQRPSACKVPILRTADLDALMIAEQLTTVCAAVEKTEQTLQNQGEQSDPLRAETLEVQVPLREPLGPVHTITWSTRTLEEALRFVDALRQDRVQAVSILRHFPLWTRPPTACDVCPVVALMLTPSAKDLR